MRGLKFLCSAALLGALLFVLNRSWNIGGNRIPPLGKFLDPFHGFWQNMEPTDYRLPETLELKGLTDKVTVVYDSLLIPHIFASNEADLYLAQGYVTAQQRLWQMDIQTRSALGKLSEAFGPGPEGRILDLDRLARRKGMGVGAENSFKAMEKDPNCKMIINRYTEGINQYITSLEYRGLPLEYKLMDFKPEPWTPLICGALLMNMAKTLNQSDKDIQMTNALKLFGLPTVNLLYPDREKTGDPIVDKPGSWKFNPVRLDSIPMAIPEDLIKIKGLTVNDPAIGSNNWAVSGTHTATHAPLLCNDPHLNLTLPSVWFAVQLHSPEVNVMGVSFPGAPGVIIGFNDSIAWGATNAERDLVDWYALEFKDKSKAQYKLDGQWTNTRKTVEKFNVRDSDPFYDTVVYTHWGPVVYDEGFHAENERRHFAYRWISQDGGLELLAFHKLNRAKNHTDFMKALDHFTSPAQNFVFASVSGDIGIRVQGKFPVRRTYEGKFVLDGTKSQSGWKAFIPYEQNIMEKNPLRGFVSSANQYPADSTYPYYINADGYEAYRNRRINAVLKSKNTLTVQDMMALQQDHFNLRASESLPLFIDNLDILELNTNERTALETLKKWNYMNDVDAEAATYYEAWWNNLMPLIWDELDRTDMALSFPSIYRTLQLIKAQPNLEFFDLKNTSDKKENAKDIIRKSFSLAVMEIEQWKKDHGMETARWGDYKDTSIDHLARIAPLGRKVQHGGGEGIVNASKHNHGPSWRMVVSLEKTGIKPYATYPGGQSGNPGSAFYANLLPTWAAGQYFLLPFLHQPEDAGKNVLFTTTFNPLKK